MARKRSGIESALRGSALPLTSSQLQTLVTQGELEGALEDEKIFRAKILNIFAYAESKGAWHEKQGRLREAVETCVRRDPVIEEVHLTKRVQKFCREEFASEEPASPIIQAQVREMVAVGTVREIRKFPPVSPPRAYFCHKEWWPAFDAFISSVLSNLAIRGTLSSDELHACALEALGARQNVDEAIHALRELLMYQGLMDSPGRILLRPGDAK